MTTQNTETKEMFMGYVITRGEDQSKANPFFACAQSSQAAARRSYKVAKWGAFQTLEKREEFIAQVKQALIDKKSAKEEKKAKDKQIASTFVNPYKVGDILHSSWGYDQTNIEWFQVIAVKPLSICIREIAGKVTEYSSSMSGTTEAQPNQFVSGPVWKRVVVRVYNGQVIHHVNSPIHGNLYETKGDLKAHCSWYA